MRNKKRDTEAKIAIDKILLASVTKELALPRMAHSARIKTDRLIKPKDGQPV